MTTSKPIIESKIGFFLSILMGSFFIFPLFYKLSYQLIPWLLNLFGLIYLGFNIKEKKMKLDLCTKILILSFLSYLVMPLISILVYHGKISYLDRPSRAFLLLPILAIFTRVKINTNLFINILLLAGLIIGIGAVVEKFYLSWTDPFMKYNRIIAGNVAMGIAMLILCVTAYDYRTKNIPHLIISSFAFLFAFTASLLCMNRGALVGFALGAIVLVILNRDLLTKKSIIFLFFAGLILGISAYKVAESRWNLVNNEIITCIEKNQCETSIGLRLQFYKSAILGMKEKPLLGWGVRGVHDMRKQHANQGYITEYASTFAHEHNMFLQEGSVYGIPGLLSLLSVFIVPIIIYRKRLKETTNSISKLFGMMGITFIVAVIGFSLTDVLMYHRIGNMYYFTTVILLLGLQKMTLKSLNIKDQ